MESGGRIEKLRQKMIFLGLSKGMSSPEVVAISEELDKLIFKKMEENTNGKRKHSIH